MTANLISNIHVASSAARTPEVGMGATICYYTDRHAGTIVAVRTGKGGAVREFDVREDIVTRTDSHGMSDAQSYTYAPGPEDAPVRTWRLDRNGQWRHLFTDPTTGRQRMESVRYGLKVAIGIRDHFHDYTF
jgi:hypothetical protein